MYIVSYKSLRKLFQKPVYWYYCSNDLENYKTVFLQRIIL